MFKMNYNTGIDSFYDLPDYMIAFYEASMVSQPNVWYRENKFNYGDVVVDYIAEDGERVIYEVEFLDENESLENSRMLWMCVESENGLLDPIRLAEDVI